MIRAAKKSNNQTSSNDICSLLYINVPDFNCNMSQIENFCLDRFYLLNELATLKEQTTLKSNTTTIDNNEFYELSKKYLGLQKDYEQFKYKDDLSHYCLRLAMCDSENRDWFINAERLLLSHRLPSDLTSIINSFKGFGWSAVSEDEYKKYADDLNYLVVKSNLNLQEPITNNHFYKIPFQDIPNLIDLKKVILKKGEAFIFKSNFKDLILTTFKNYLEFALDRVRADKNRIREEYPELIQFFKTIPKVDSIGRKMNYGGSGGTRVVRKEEILPLSISSFPLCMKVMHDSLVNNGKLKYEGRLELSTFLKGIGLPYEEAIQFWRMSFSKRMTTSDFDKEYMYTFRHTYGLEGKSTSYSPYSCAKIMSKIPQSVEGQVHGCPYLLETSKLEEKLNELNIGEFERIQIIDSVKTSANLACTKHFKVLHPNSTFSKIINHPNQFFEASATYYKDLADKSKKKLNDQDQQQQQQQQKDQQQ